MAAPKVKPLSEVAPKWNRRASSAGPEYEAGIRNPATDWQTAAIAAKGSWQQAITAAAGRDAFAKGVAASGTGNWQQGSIEKGPPRYAQGVTIAQAKYEKNVGPYLDLIARTDLPARGPAGSEANLQRMTAIPRALAALKRK